MAGLLAYSISGAFPYREIGTVAKCLKFEGDYSCGYSSGIAPDSLFHQKNEPNFWYKVNITFTLIIKNDSK
jgi:hypothetical protein